MLSERLEILSISIDKKSLEELEEIQKKLGFKSRSKMLRTAVLSMLNDYERLDVMKGIVDSVFVLTYREAEKNHVSDILHKFENIIKTELHQHYSGTCVDVLSISADAEGTRNFFGAMRRNKCIYSVVYSIINESR